MGDHSSGIISSLGTKANENTIEIYNLIISTIYRNDVKACQKILDKVQNKNPKDISGLTPLHWAAGKGHLLVCQLIFDYRHFL